MNSLLATVLSQENATTRSFFEGPKRVVQFNKFVVGETKYDSLLVWCHPNTDLAVQTNSEVVQRRYFDNFYTCVDCVTGIVEEKTCDDESIIEYRSCSEEGFWNVLEECPATEVEIQASGGSGPTGITNIIGVECSATEQYSKEERKCVTIETPEVTEEPASKASWLMTNKYLLLALATMLIGGGIYLWKRKK